MSLKKHIAYLLSIFFISVSVAETQWTLDNSNSNIFFISIKNLSVAEIHTFQSLSAVIDDSGKVELSIKLDSIESLIPIRNERMRALLFNTKEFPTATISTKPDWDKINKLAPGESALLTVELTVNLHGQSQLLKAQVRVAALKGQSIQIINTQPLLLNAGNYKLVEGIKKLQEIAGLSSISTVVPVSFQLQFKK